MLAAMRKGLLVLPLLSLMAWAGSDTPPEGPPWKRDFYAARKLALQTGRPIFVYFTKTY